MKTVLITGSTDGIGKLTAHRLVEAGHHVVLHGRSANKLDRVIHELKLEFSNAKVSGYVSDFSDLNAVKRMGKEVSHQFSTIDVLINNAGVFATPNPITANGLDMRFVVNFLAPFVLTNEVLPAISNAPDGRIINLSSAAQDTVSLQALKGEIKLDARQAYGQSKLALTMWTHHLVKQLGGTPVRAVAVNPGSLLNTKMVAEAFGQHWSPATKGANILFELAVADAVEKPSGLYFDNDAGDYGQAHPDAYDQGKIEALITTTEILLNNEKLA